MATSDRRNTQRRALLLIALVLLLVYSATAFRATRARSEPAPSPVAGDRYQWPLVAPIRVLRAFEPPPGPYAAGHRGIDLAASPGASVLAAGAGEITFVGQVANRPVVTITHPDGLRTSYEPVQGTAKVGESVTKGQQIGVVSVGGHCSHECLHWGVRRDQVYLDPALLLGRGQVRLLPQERP